MKIDVGLFPGGKLKAVTMSYDDGRDHDRRLVEIFNKYGIRGTFHLNSGYLGDEKHVAPEEVAELYKGHEVSCHTVNHPFLERIGTNAIVTEIFEDKKNLEALIGYPVRGMSYPYGSYDADVIAGAKAAGMEYSRGIVSTGNFKWPKNFLEWQPTCHHNDLHKYVDKFLSSNERLMSILYVFGHSFEFAYDDTWDMIEEFCAKVGNKDDIWYATNIEIVDYINAVKSLKFTADCTVVYNPSALDVWITADNKPVLISSGKTVKLK